MASLQSLKRRSKWRSNVRNDLDNALRAGHKIYGVGLKGDYAEVTFKGKKIRKNRSVKGAVVAKRALKGS